MGTPIFDSVQFDAPKKNRFDLSHDVKMSCKMGFLYPTLTMECVPGDKVSLGCQSLIRFAPLVSPVMHRYDVSMHYFFVPNRLTWDKWEDYITDNSGVFPYQFPTVNTQQWTNLYDYMGIPQPTVAGAVHENISALPFAAYQLIFNEFYRDQNLIPEANYKLVSGPQPIIGDLTTLRRRAWEHDYFTSALPFAQKGSGVTVPFAFSDVGVKHNQNTDGITTGTAWATSQNGGAGIGTVDYTYGAGNPKNLLGGGSLYAETSAITGGTQITDLRRAMKLQEWLERAARGGSRYVEHLKNFFNVTSSDKRLDRPEYITGTKSPVIISEVLNTTGTTNTPQGGMAGHAISVSGGKNGSYFCEEHGYIIGVMSILPKTAYQDGIPKHFLKTNSNLEFFYPQFEHIGEQPIQSKELLAYSPSLATTPNDTFGYVPRYAEYKYANNRVAGEFRNSLSFWHHGRIFNQANNPPLLNQTFINCFPDARVFAVTNPSVDNIYCQIVHQISAVRPMAKYGSPSF